MIRAPSVDTPNLFLPSFFSGYFKWWNLLEGQELPCEYSWNMLFCTEFALGGLNGTAWEVYFAGLNLHVWCLGLSLSRLMYNFTWHYVSICNNLAITYKIAIILLYYIIKGYFHFSFFIPEKNSFTILLLLLLLLYCLYFKEPISTFMLFPHAPNLMFSARQQVKLTFYILYIFLKQL